MLESIVYVVDDNKSFAESLSWIINSIGLKVMSFHSAKKFLECFNPLQPSCLILDVRMPDISGPELQLQLKEKEELTPPIIFVSGHDDISIAVRVMKEGAVDFIVKPLNEQVFLESVNHALYLDKINREKIYEINQARSKFLILSTREKQIFKGIVDGKSNRKISSEIKISLKTVEAHRASLMKKMKIKSVSELVRLYFNIETCKKNNLPESIFI